jgi:MFS family permease
MVAIFSLESLAILEVFNNININRTISNSDSDSNDASTINHRDARGPRNTRFCSIRSLPPVITLLRSLRLLAALWANLVQAIILCAFDAVLPIFVYRTFGWTSVGAGLIFLPLVIPSFAAPLVGHMTDKYGPRWLLATGFVTAVPFLVLLRLVTHDSLQQVVLLCTLVTLLGGSMTLVMAPLIAEITYVVEAEEEKRGLFAKGGASAQAYGLFTFSFAGGMVIGPIWAGFMEQRVGWGTTTWSLGLLSGLTAIPVLIQTGGLITKRKPNAVIKDD